MWVSGVINDREEWEEFLDTLKAEYCPRSSPAEYPCVYITDATDMGPPDWCYRFIYASSFKNKGERTKKKVAQKYSEEYIQSRIEGKLYPYRVQKIFLDYSRKPESISTRSLIAAQNIVEGMRTQVNYDKEQSGKEGETLILVTEETFKVIEKIVV